MPRLLLTGASGFLGRNCLDRLAENQWEVHAVDRRPLEARPNGVSWHRADLLTPEALDGLMAEIKPTHLLHLAWTGARPVYSSIENFRWVRGSLALLDAFAAHGGRRVVALGSSAEYLGGPEDCSEERTPLAGQTAYGVCKSSLGRLLSAYCRESGLSGAWVRPFFLFGPYENRSRLVASVITSLLSGEPARCTHGRQIRDYLYSRDAADALVEVLSSDFEGAVNIASGIGVRLADIVNEIAAVIGREELVELGAIEAPSDEAERIVGDVTRLREVIGWQPGFSLEDGLRRTIDWWRRELSVPIAREV